MSVQKSNFTILRAVKIEYCQTESLSVFNINSHSVETDAVFESIPFSDDSILIKESSNKSDAGITYKTEIQWHYLGYNQNNTTVLDELLKSNLIFLLSLDTGQQIIVGSPDYPARLFTNRNWKSYEFKNELSVKCESVYPLMPYQEYAP